MKHLLLAVLFLAAPSAFSVEVIKELKIVEFKQTSKDLDQTVYSFKLNAFDIIGNVTCYSEESKKSEASSILVNGMSKARVGSNCEKLVQELLATVDNQKQSIWLRVSNIPNKIDVVIKND